MKVFINDHSFCGQAQNQVEALEILGYLFDVAESTKPLRNEKPILRSRDLKDKEIIEGQTIHSLVTELVSDPLTKKYATRFLLLLVKNPYFDIFHQDVESVNDSEGKCHKGSCFDSAFFYNQGVAMLSLLRAPNYNLSNEIEMVSSTFGVRKFLNFYNVENVIEKIWIYEPNSKHKIPETKIKCGELHSKMSLNLKDAQYALSNGVLVNNRVYSIFNGQWYCFHCHHLNQYHGYEINLEQNNPDHMTAQSIISSCSNNNQDGQIFHC